MLLDCPKCAKTNRIPEGKRSRCGHCKHAFTPQELTKVRPEPPVHFELDEEDEEDANPDECDECGRYLDDDGCCPKCDA